MSEPAVEPKKRWYQFSNAKANSAWSLKVTSLEEGYKVVMEMSWALIFLGLFLLLFTIFVLPDAILDVFVFICLGALLGYKKKEWVAWLVIAMSGASVANTFYNQITGTLGGRNVILSLLVLFFAVKTLGAIRHLNGATVTPTTKFQKLGEKAFPFIFWISFALLVLYVTVAIIGIMAVSTGYIPAA